MTENAALSGTVPTSAAQATMKSTLRKTARMNGRLDGPSWREVSDLWDRAGSATSLDPTDHPPSSEAIRQQVGRILQSRLFVQSERLSRFLKFIVEHAIAGNQKCLKEYVIGCEVYDRKPPYSPSLDSIVRTEARRLRSKLNEYYLDAGRDDSVYVSLRQGSYVPVFLVKPVFDAAGEASGAERLMKFAKSPACVAIFSFSDISGSPLSSRCARGISDELAFRLLEDHGCRIVSFATANHPCAQEQDVTSAMSKVDAQIAFEGSVQEEDNHIRVIARIVDQAGIHLWATRFDSNATKLPLFALEDHITATLSAGYNSLCSASAGTSKRNRLLAVKDGGNTEG